MVINEAKSHQIYTYPEDSQNSVKQWSHSYKLPFLEVLSKRGTQSDQKIKELIRELTLLAEKLINDSNPQKENLIWSLQSLPSEILSYFKSVIQIAKASLGENVSGALSGVKAIKKLHTQCWFFEGSFQELIRLFTPHYLKVGGKFLTIMQTQNKSHHCSINTVLTMLAVIPEIRLHIAKNVNQSSAFKAIFHVFYFSYWDNESQQKFVHEVQLDPHGLHRWQKYGYEVVEIWKHIAERLCLDLICTTVSKSDLHQSWTSLCKETKRFLMVFEYVNSNWESSKVEELPQLGIFFKFLMFIVLNPNGFVIRCVGNVVQTPHGKHVYLLLHNQTTTTITMIKIDDYIFQMMAPLPVYRPALILYERITMDSYVRQPYFEMAKQ